MSMVQNLEAKMTAFVREAKGEVALSDLFDFLHEYPVAQVRLTAADLRKRGIFAGRPEGKEILYRAIAKRETVEAPELRRDEQRIQTPAPPTARDRLLAALTKLGPGDFAFNDFQANSGVPVEHARQLVQEMVRAGKIHAGGATRNRRFSLTPFTVPAAVPPIGVPKLPHEMNPVTREEVKGLPLELLRELSPATQALAVVEPIANDADEPGGAPRDPLPDPEPRRRFGWFSNNVLGVDCERCSGELTIEDLQALAAFIANIPVLNALEPR